MTRSDSNSTLTGRDKIRSILVIIATLGTIAFNGLAATGYVNGVTPEVISDKYSTVITPAGYAFTIWSLIYLGLLVFSVYQALPSQYERLRPLRSIYIVSCVLNCVWIYFWHFEMIAICFGVIVLLWFSLLVMVIRSNGYDRLSDTWILKSTFGIYLGWVTAATLVNFAVMLVYLGRMPEGSTAVIIGCVLLIAAAAAAVIVPIALRNFFFPLSIAWAVTAIAVENSSLTAIVVTGALVVVVAFVMAGTVVTTLKDSTSE